MPADSGPASSAGSFDDAVAAVLHGLGPGEVVTYGEVAAEAGFPGAARAVGRLLASADHGVAWWRVVNAAGRLAPGHEVEQAQRLEREGVAVDRDRGRVRMARRTPAGPHRGGPSTDGPDRRGRR